MAMNLCANNKQQPTFIQNIYTVVGVCAHELWGHWFEKQAPVLKSLNLFNFHQLSLSGISKEFKKRGSAWG